MSTVTTGNRHDVSPPGPLNYTQPGRRRAQAIPRLARGRAHLPRACSARNGSKWDGNICSFLSINIYIYKYNGLI